MLEEGFNTGFMVVSVGVPSGGERQAFFKDQIASTDLSTALPIYVGTQWNVNLASPGEFVNTIYESLLEHVRTIMSPSAAAGKWVGYWR